MGEFFTWENLGSMAGATAAVTLATQFIKWLSGNKLRGWLVRAVSFVTALVVLYAAAAFTGELSASTAVLTPFNAMVVTLAANGLFDNIKSIVGNLSAGKNKA